MPAKYNAPLHIWLQHEYANGKKARNYNRDDFEFLMIDSQGPVYVSLTGKYMFSPCAERLVNGEWVYYWALYRWYEKEGMYDMMARKNDIAPTVLLHDPWIPGRADARESSSQKRGQWKALANFSKDEKISGTLLQEEPNAYMQMYVTANLKEMDRRIQERKRSDNNPYELVVRFPDYVKVVESRSSDGRGGMNIMTTWKDAQVVPSYLTVRTPWYHQRDTLCKAFKKYLERMYNLEKNKTQDASIVDQAVGGRTKSFCQLWLKAQLTGPDPIWHEVICILR
jgi:hypothetical protein